MIELKCPSIINSIQPNEVSNFDRTDGISKVKDVVKKIGEVLLQNLTLTDQISIKPENDISFLENQLAQAMFAYRQENPDDPSLDKAGNKHKNNIKQYNLVKALDLQGISVPKPKKIFFIKEYSSEIESLWKKLADQYEKCNSKNNFFEDEEVKKIFLQLDIVIEKAFNQALDDKDSASFQKLSSWLEDMLRNENFLMVRSTGSEDSKYMANAGGNVSVAYVKPQWDELCKASKNVIKSYFAQRTLQNQINHGLNPFSEDLKLAVSVQELIGEDIGGATDLNKIPKSAVLFTNEPFYVGNEKFRVMRLSCTYGHGEAVVDNHGISTDTVLITVSVSDPTKLYILYDNQSKKLRLAPVKNPDIGDISLQKIPNDPSIINERIFDDQMLARIYQWGLIVEKYFGDEAVDLELVIKGDTIYPVQARPVVRAEQLPTYLDIKKIGEQNPSSIEGKIYTSTQVLGKASVVTIDDSDQILIADSLKEVIDNKLYDKDKHKLVIVSKEDPVNSHAVVTFSGYGIPCLHAYNGIVSAKDLIKKMDETHSLAICVQSGSINLWNNSKGLINDYSSQGFVIHPAKINHSFSSDSLSKNPKVKTELPQEIIDLLFQLRTETTNQGVLKILHEIQNHGWLKKFAERQKALAIQLEESPLSEKVIRPVLQASSRLDRKIQETFAEMQMILLQANEKRLHPLFFAKTLEMLFFENGKDQNGIGQYSIVNMEAYFTATEAQLLYQKKLPHPAHFLRELMFGMECPIPEISSEWQEFLFQLESVAEENKNSEKVQQFRKMLTSLKEFGVMPWFMTLMFGESQHLSPLQRMEYLLSLLPERELPLIKELLERKELLQTMSQQMEAFDDPKTFERAFSGLKDEVKKFLPEIHHQTCIKDILIGRTWEKTSPLIKVITIETMNTFIEVYDTAIKTMKSSLKFSDDKEKTKLFKKMLFPYFELLKNWVQETVGPNGFPMEICGTQQEYLETFFEILNKLSNEDPRQLNPSRNFNVSAAALGSGTNFSRHYPNTLEDVFTLIHQNLLATCAKLSSQLLSDDQIQNSRMGSSLKNAISHTTMIGGGDLGRPQCIGVEITQDKIIIHYNVPLRNHSSKFALCYTVNENSSSISLISQFLGQARGRWGDSAETILLYDKLLHFVHSLPKHDLNELTYSLKVDDHFSFEAAAQIFNIIAEYSLHQRLPIMQTAVAAHINQLGLGEKAIEFFNNDNEALIFHFKVFQELANLIIENGGKTDEICEVIKRGILDRDLDKESDILNTWFKLINKWTEVTATFLPEHAALGANTNDERIFSIFNEVSVANKASEPIKRAGAQFTEGVKNGEYRQVAEVLSIAMLCDMIKISTSKNSEISDLQKNLNNLFDFLYENGQKIEIENAAMEMASNSKTFSSSGLKWFFEKLFSKGIGYDSAMEAIKTMIDIPYWGEKELGVLKWISKEMIATRQGCKFLMQIAKRLASDPNYQKKDFAKFIFNELLENELEYEEILESTCDLVFNYPKNFTRIDVQPIFKKLLDKNYGVIKIKEIATKAMESKNADVNNSGISLYLTLFDAEYCGYLEVLELGKKGLHSSEKLPHYLIYLFRKIFKQKSGIEESMKIAREAFSRDDLQIKMNALTLYGNLLLEQGSYEPVLKALNEARQSDNQSIRELANSFF